MKNKKDFFMITAEEMQKLPPAVPQPNPNTSYWWKSNTFTWEKSYNLTYEYKGERASIYDPPVIHPEVVISAHSGESSADVWFKFILEYEFAHDPDEIRGIYPYPSTAILPVRNVQQGSYNNEKAYVFRDKTSPTTGVLAIYGFARVQYGDNTAEFSIAIPTGNGNSKTLEVRFHELLYSDSTAGFDLQGIEAPIEGVSIKFKGFAYKRFPKRA